MDILYIGVDNKVQIAAPDSIAISLRSPNSGMRIRKFNYNTFFVTPSYVRKQILQVYIKEQLVFEDTFKVHRLVEPEIRLGQIEDSFATKDEIIKNPQLNIILPSCFLKADDRVIGFDLYWMKDNISPIIFPREPDSIYIDTIFVTSPFTFNDTIIIDTAMGSEQIRTMGNTLTSRQLQFIKGLEPGDELIFDQIKGSGFLFHNRVHSFKIIISE